MIRIPTRIPGDDVADEQNSLTGLLTGLRTAGFMMKLSSAVVNEHKGDTNANTIHFGNMDDDELTTAVGVFYGLANQAQRVLDKRYIKKVPDEWQDDPTFDRIVTAPYGWTNPVPGLETKPWDEPITRTEFQRRMDASSSALKGTPASEHFRFGLKVEKGN